MKMTIFATCMYLMALPSFAMDESPIAPEQMKDVATFIQRIKTQWQPVNLILGASNTERNWILGNEWIFADLSFHDSPAKLPIQDSGNNFKYLSSDGQDIGYSMNPFVFAYSSYCNEEGEKESPLVMDRSEPDYLSYTHEHEIHLASILTPTRGKKINSHPKIEGDK